MKYCFVYWTTLGILEVTLRLLLKLALLLAEFVVQVIFLSKFFEKNKIHQIRRIEELDAISI